MSERELPGVGRIFVTQFVHLMKSWYAPTVLVMPLLGLWWTHRNRFPDYNTIAPWHISPLLAGSVSYLLFAGMLAAALLWLSEPPSKRRYHWSLPVKREHHDLIRVAAGAIWLSVAVVVFYVAGYLVESPVMRRSYLHDANAFWAGVWLATLLVYLLASIASLLWDKAVFWIALVILSGTMLPEWLARDVPQLAEMRDAVMEVDEPWSLGNALGGFEFYSPWMNGEHRVRVFHATEKEYFDQRDRRLLARESATSRQNVMRPERREIIRQRELDYVTRRSLWYNDLPSTWGSSLAVWYLLALLGVILAVRRRPNV